MLLHFFCFSLEKQCGQRKYVRLQPILETQVKLRIRTPRQTVARLQKQQQNMCLKTVARLAIENKFPIFEGQTFYRLCSQTKNKKNKLDQRTFKLKQ